MIRASVIVPAYNEAATIGRLLDALVPLDAAVEIVVACNGCHDGTEAVCARYAPRVRVLSQAQPGKTAALNRALAETRGPIKLIVDADVLLDAGAAARLIALASRPGVEVVQPRLNYRTEDAGVGVRAYLRVWRRHPYFRTKIGGAYALSAAGVAKLGSFPEVVADDEYVRRKLFAGARWTAAAQAEVFPPRTLAALIRTRSRSLSGAAELTRSRSDAAQPALPGFGRTFARLLLREMPLSALVYAYVGLAARLRTRMRRGHKVWERDDTSRPTPIAEAAE